MDLHLLEDFDMSHVHPPPLSGHQPIGSDNVFDLLFQETGMGIDLRMRKPCMSCTQASVTPCQHQTSKQELLDQEDMLTPLISPATTPCFSFQPSSLSASSSSTGLYDLEFSPLSSPAMGPQARQRTLSLQEQPQPGVLSPDQFCQQYEHLEQIKSIISRRLSEIQRKQHSGGAMVTREHVHAQRLDPMPQLSRFEPATPASLMNFRPSVRRARTSEEVDVRNGTPLDAAVASLPVSPSAILAPSPLSSGMTPSASVSTGTMSTKANKNDMTGACTTPVPKKRRHSEKHCNPRELKPLLISPTLQPGQESQNSTSIHDAEQILATRSNYQNMLEGKAAVLGIAFSPNLRSGIEVRRTAHKAAEQKRRDSLKEWFDRLRQEVEDGYLKKKTQLQDQDKDNDNDAPVHPFDEEDDDAASSATSLKPLSKVLLLRYAYEYISELKDTLSNCNEEIDHLQNENKQLRLDRPTP